MTIPDTPSARVPKAQERSSGSPLQAESPASDADRLDLRYQVFGKVADRLSPEGRAAMDHLLKGDSRRNDVRRLIAALATEEEDRPGHRRKKDPFDALDQVLDVGSGGMGNLLSAMQGMSPEDQQGFLDTLSGLLKQGVMGYEYRKVNGQPRKVYLENEMGTPIHRAKLYRRDLD